MFTGLILACMLGTTAPQCRTLVSPAFFETRKTCMEDATKQAAVYLERGIDVTYVDCFKWEDYPLSGEAL